MLRSRDKAGKNDTQQNGVASDESNRGSSFTTYGVLVCVVFTIIVVYFVFFDGKNDTSSTSTLSSLATSTSSVSGTPPKWAHSAQSAIAAAAAADGHREHAQSQSKVISDVSPTMHDKLTRFMRRKEQHKHHGLGLDLTHGSKHNFNRLNQFRSNEYTKEITFTLEASSLPPVGQNGRSVFIRQVFPIKQTNDDFNQHNFVLIFLHGASYSSATWSELGILASLAQQGYVSYALDVPGFGQSGTSMPNDNKWLKQIIDQLVGNEERVHELIQNAGGVNTAQKKIVLVTASMSGKFAIPLLFEGPGPMIGMVTIAPVGTARYKKEAYGKVDTPVCIVVGELDRKLGEESKKNLVQIPNHKLIVVPGGEHAAYKTNPRFFHSVVVKWLAENFD